MRMVCKVVTLFLFVTVCDTSAFQIDKQVAKDLPLVITGTNHNNSSEPVALFLSGDGGWYKFEQLIADSLASYGVPTIGFDTKKYFWDRRTPDEAASDILYCLNHYSKEWNRDHYLLIGYSLGAEVLPFIISRLPEQIRSKITMYVLLSPTEKTDFEIHVSDMMGMKNRNDTLDVVNEILKLKDVPCLLIYGSEEKSKMPAFFTGTEIKTTVVPGDHHYKSDGPLIIRKIRNFEAFLLHTNMK